MIHMLQDTPADIMAACMWQHAAAIVAFQARSAAHVQPNLVIW